MDKHIKNIEALMRIQAADLAQFKCSAAIKKVWPEAFDSGEPVSTRWIGLPLSQTGGRRVWRFEVTANGETRSFEPGEVAPAIKPPEAPPQHVNVRA